MQLNRLGKSEIKVSAIGFGAMSLSGNDMRNESELVKIAYSKGINYFDTADLYANGGNERLLGEALKGIRKDVIIATKVGNVWNESGPGWGWDVSRNYINRAVDASLKRLQTDYIDLYQLHGGTVADNFDEVIETFERLIECGKIRTYGLSSIRPNVFQYYSEKSSIISNMMQFSLLDTRPEEYLEFFEEHNVSVVARGVLAQGVLVDKDAKQYLELDRSMVAEVQRKVRFVAEESNVSSTAVALYYVLRNRAVGSAIVGLRTISQLDELMLAYKEMDALKSIDSKELGTNLRYKEHRSL